MRFSDYIIPSLIIVLALLVSFIQHSRSDSSSTGLLVDPLSNSEEPTGVKICADCLKETCNRDGHICDKLCKQKKKNGSTVSLWEYGDNTCNCILNENAYESNKGGICATMGGIHNTEIQYDTMHAPAVVVIFGTDGKKYIGLVNDWNGNGKIDPPYPLFPPPPSDPTDPIQDVTIINGNQQVSFVIGADGRPYAVATP